VAPFAPLSVGAPVALFKKQSRDPIGADYRLWQCRTVVAIVAILAFGIAS
jgi:hypothetical protein